MSQLAKLRRPTLVEPLLSHRVIQIRVKFLSGFFAGSRSIVNVADFFVTRGVPVPIQHNAWIASSLIDEFSTPTETTPLL